MRLGERECRQIVDELMSEHRLNAKDFFGNTRLKHYVAARVEAIKRMKERTSASHTTMAIVLKRNVSIVCYHLSEANKLRRKQYYADRWKLKALSSNKASSCTPATGELAQII